MTVEGLIGQWELLARCDDAYEKLSREKGDALLAEHWRTKADEGRYHARQLREMLLEQRGYRPWGCRKAPRGWVCTRVAGHDGPCAAARRTGGRLSALWDRLFGPWTYDPGRMP